MSKEKLEYEPLRNHNKVITSSLITHHSSLIAHHSLLIAHCSLLIAHCSALFPLGSSVVAR
jgi:hypothetical protein